jgi:hypothetical protein
LAEDDGKNKQKFLKATFYGENENESANEWGIYGVWINVFGEW